MRRAYRLLVYSRERRGWGGGQGSDYHGAQGPDWLFYFVNWGAQMEMPERRRTNEREGSDGFALPKTSDQLSFQYFSRLVCFPSFICSQDFDVDL